MTIARRSVVVGSKNPPYEYLDDGENRRFAPVRTGHIDIRAIERDREQLLAEALIIARKKDAVAWTIGKEDPIWEGLSDDRADRVIDDPLIQDVMLKLPDDVDAVTTRWLLNELGVPPERRKQSDQAVAAALRTLGFEGQKAPRTVLGRPRVFVRTGVVWSDKTKVLI
jgi:predicted P-loop ATPase